jgi:hypothetical protein
MEHRNSTKAPDAKRNFIVHPLSFRQSALSISLQPALSKPLEKRWHGNLAKKLGDSCPQKPEKTGQRRMEYTGPFRHIVEKGELQVYSLPKERGNL